MERTKNGQFVRKYSSYTRNCVICNKEFTNPQMKVKTCSRECGRKKAILLNPPKRQLRVCLICKKEFTIPDAWLRKRDGAGLYCSLECRWKNKLRWTEKEKWTARNFVKRLIKQGVLVVQPCEVCGKTKTDAHHYKGYDKENWLDLNWLCDLHHTRAHEQLRALGNTIS